jgi:hypothetical protein
MELQADELVKKTKFLALKNTQKSSRALKAQVVESEEEGIVEEEVVEDSEDEFIALLTIRFQ